MSRLRSGLAWLALSTCAACAGDKVPSEKAAAGGGGESSGTGGSEASSGGSGGASDATGGVSGASQTGGASVAGGTAGAKGQGGAAGATGGASAGGKGGAGGASTTGGKGGASSTGGKGGASSTGGKGGASATGGAATGTCTAVTKGGVSIAAGTPLSAPVKPNPLISGKMASSSDGDDVSFILEDPPGAAHWGPSVNDWVTVDVGTGFDRLLLIWQVSGFPEYTAPSTGNNFGVPTAYDIDVSVDGNTWSNVVRVAASTTGSTPRTREHSFAFTGMRWVRFKVTGLPPATGNAKISSMQIFDASQGTEDTWLFAGSGPTRGVYTVPELPSLGGIVHGCHPQYYPATINIADLAGKLSYLSEESPFNSQRTVLESWIDLNPDMKFWVLLYGLPDAQGVARPAAGFATGLQDAITTLVAAGKVPILPRIQFVSSAYMPATDYAGIAAFNAVIDQLVATNHLLPAPDFYAWYGDHPDQLCAAGDQNDPGGYCGEPQWNGIQPIDTATRPGVRDAIRLWAAAGDVAGIWGP